MKPRPAKILVQFRNLGDQNAKMETKIASANEIKLKIERALTAIKLTWARIWALSLESQKIKISYEMVWLERN